MSESPPLGVKASRPTPRQDLQTLAPYAFAMDEDALRQRYGLERIIRLCSNENPLGPSPRVLQAMTETVARVHRYPQPDNSRYLRAISEHFSVDARRLILGNGGDECIDLIIRIMVRPGDSVLTFSPCFDVYRTQSLICGARLVQAPLNPDFTLPLEAMVRAADERTSVAFVTSPDNPSGIATPRQDILKLARALPQSTLLVVDEAYVDFHDTPGEATCLPLLDDFPNLAVLRTFSKAYGLAGARLGFAALPLDLADMARRAQIPFSVNLPAQAALLAALEDREYYQRSLDLIIQGRTQLLTGLRERGCEVLESRSNFLMFRPHTCSAQELYQTLLEHGVLVRRLAPNGLPEWLRVSVGTREENEIFLSYVE